MGRHEEVAGWEEFASQTSTLRKKWFGREVVTDQRLRSQEGYLTLERRDFVGEADSSGRVSTQSLRLIRKILLDALFASLSNVSGLEQTVRFLPNKIVGFHLDAPSSQAGARKPPGFDKRIGSRIKSQAKFQTAARRESSEDSMKRALLLIVVPVLLVALGSAQTPAASVNTDQTIKGCLGGSDGNYIVVEDGTGHIFKITTSSVDFKQHLGHDVTLIGRGASGASSAAADNSFAVTELNMISGHCAGAAAAPTATVTTPVETAVTPAAAAAAPVATTTSTLAETEVTPAATAASPAATATPSVETAVIPAPNPALPAATGSTPSETVSAPDAAAAHPARVPALPQKLSATTAAATTSPAATANTSSETVSTPDAGATTPAATASTSPDPVSTPAAIATTPTATPRGWSLSFLIAFAVLVIVMGIMVPFLSRWRKRKSLERTGASNLSFTREASSDQDKSEKPGPRKAA